MLAAAVAAAANPYIIVIVGVGGAGITGLVALLVNRSQHSGKASTAAADVIFEAAEAIRKEQRVEIIDLRTEVAALKAEMVAMRAEAVAMREEMIMLRKEGLANHQEAMSRLERTIEGGPAQ